VKYNSDEDEEHELIRKVIPVVARGVNISSFLVVPIPYSSGSEDWCAFVEVISMRGLG